MSGVFVGGRREMCKAHRRESEAGRATKRKEGGSACYQRGFLLFINAVAHFPTTCFDIVSCPARVTSPPPYILFFSLQAWLS